MSFGIDGQPTELTQRPAFGNDGERVQDEGAHLVAAKMELHARLVFIVVQHRLLVGRLFFHRPHEHEHALFGLFIRETHHPDAPLRLGGLREGERRIARRLGPRDRVGSIDHHKKFPQLVGENGYLLLLDEISNAAEIPPRLDVEDTRARASRVIGGEYLWRKVLIHDATTIGALALTESTIGP